VKINIGAVTHISFKEPPLTEEQIKHREMIKEKVREFGRLSDEQRAEMLKAQRESWARGEMGFDSRGETRLKK